MPMQRRAILTAIAIALLLLPAAADPSYSLSAYISGVSQGVDGIGFGLFPIGTTFGFERLFPLVPGERDAEFQVEMSFAFNNRTIDTNFDYSTGLPIWFDRRISRLPAATYFNPRASIDVYLDQGFGDNPLYADGSLVNFRIGFNARYSMALERVDLSKAGNDDEPLFVDNGGNPRPPFDGRLPAYPWLEGNRQTYTDYLYLDAYLNLDRDTPTDAETEHGLSLDLSFDYGPRWLFNESPSRIQSDFYRLEAYLEEKMELFTVYQDNGWNWVNMYIGHSNTFRYTGGDVIPENMLPDDRLRAMIADRIWLHFTGPQFLAGDCFAFIELNLYNTLMFGGIANEIGSSSFALELQSSLSARVQVRLFGFIRLEYQVGYDFIRGIWPEYPRWWQNAALSFYVSV